VGKKGVVLVYGLTTTLSDVFIWFNFSGRDDRGNGGGTLWWYRWSDGYKVLRCKISTRLRVLFVEFRVFG